MNTAFILAIIVLGALSAALGAMLAAARREAGHLRADKTAAEQARLAEEQSMVVGERDLAKMTSAQLATLVEGEDLDIEPQGPQEKVPEYRVRVRDALKAKLAEQGE